MVWTSLITKPLLVTEDDPDIIRKLEIKCLKTWENEITLVQFHVVWILSIACIAPCVPNKPAVGALPIEDMEDIHKQKQVCKGFAKRIKTNSQAPEQSNMKKVWGKV